MPFRNLIEKFYKSPHHVTTFLLKNHTRGDNELRRRLTNNCVKVCAVDLN